LAQIVAIILGWYMFSYTLPQTMAAKLTVVLGNRVAAPISLTICTISSLLTPTAAYMGWKWVVVCRLVNGVGAAGLLPGLLKLLEDWMRYDEISSGLTVAQFLIATVNAFCPLISGYLTAIHWSLAFYVPSYITLGFCALWLVLVTNKPKSNWLISERELNYLCECDMPAVAAKTAPTKTDSSNHEKQPKELSNGGCDDGPNQITVNELEYKPDSWTQILKLPQFYAYLLIWMLNCSSYTAFTFVLPAYMRQFLKIRISENGFYCFIIQMGVILAVSWPHQVLRLLTRMNLSMTTSRRVAQLMCCVMMASTFIYVGTFHQYQLPLLFLNRCFVGTDVIVTGSVMSNFAKAGISSIAFAMINTIGNLSITVTSTLIGWLLDYTGSSRLGWQIIFCGLGVAQIILWLTFALFVDSEPIKFKNKKSKRADSLEAAQIPPNVFSVDDYRRDSLDSRMQSPPPEVASQPDGLKNRDDNKKD
jgi:MFS family permease